MLEPPVATSSPVSRTKQWGRRMSKNNRRSISLLDVSVIPPHDVPSQKCESNETLTSVCKDSGYVQSEGSWLEDDESRESKDLVEELKFKDVLISELQESNRGLRMRCADADDKIWRLRIKCEEHCGCCCHVQGNDQSDDQDELSSDSNDQFDHHLDYTTSFKRHSLAISDFNAREQDYSMFRGPASSNTDSNGSKQKKPLLRSFSSNMIPVRKTPTQNCKGNAHGLRLTPEGVLSKVQRWQRDLFAKGVDRGAESSEVKAARRKFDKSHKKMLVETNNHNQPDVSSALVSCNDSLSRLALHNSEEESMENNVKQDLLYPYSPDENGNRTNKHTDAYAAHNSSMGVNRAYPVHSFSKYDTSCSPPLTTQPTGSDEFVQNLIQTHQDDINPMLLSDTIDGFKKYGRTHKNLELPKYAEDAKIPNPSCELDCCLDSSKTEINCNKCYIGNQVPQLQTHCNLRYPPSQIIVVPSSCCCRLMDSDSVCRPSCCPYEGKMKCDQQCHVTSKHHHNSCLGTSEQRLPIFVPKIKTASTQYQDSPSLSANIHLDSNIIPERPKMANPCKDACDSTPSARSLTVPLAQRMDATAKLRREIEEGMKKWASVGREETESLSFKPWTPPNYAELTPLTRLLIETSEYARQMAMASNNAISRVQRLGHQLNPSV